MAELINLRRVRKRKIKEQADTQAEANRARFGRSKAECAKQAAQATLASEQLDRHRLTSEDDG